MTSILFKHFVFPNKSISFLSLFFSTLAYGQNPSLIVNKNEMRKEVKAWGSEYNIRPARSSSWTVEKYLEMSEALQTRYTEYSKRYGNEEFLQSEYDTLSKILVQIATDDFTTKEQVKDFAKDFASKGAEYNRKSKQYSIRAKEFESMAARRPSAVEKLRRLATECKIISDTYYKLRTVFNKPATTTSYIFIPKPSYKDTSGSALPKMVYLKSTKLDSEISSFKWPPPNPSATTEIPLDILNLDKDMPLLADVDRAISSALSDSGYGRKSYYSVPDGFAIVTQLERINNDGSPSEARWDYSDNKIVGGFTLGKFIKALFTADPGHYRVVVFVITPRAFSFAGETLSREEAKIWLENGSIKLPSYISDKVFNDNFTVSALIYEFVKPRSGNAKFADPSRIIGRIHLKNTKLFFK